MNLNNLINRIKEINPNIKLRFKGEFDKNNRKTGYWEFYYANGNLRYKGNYLNGIQDGYWEEYWDNNKLYSKGNYLNGKKNGYREFYYSNGKLNYKGNFINGKFNEIK